MEVKKPGGKKKLNPITDVCNKFKYSFQGLAYCFKNETSFIFETIALIGVSVLGFIFDIKAYEWLFAIVSLLLIIEVEVLNTAIEKTVDMVTEDFHPLAKIAKDCGSAATCVASFVAFGVNAMIFVPYIWPLIFK